MQHCCLELLFCNAAAWCRIVAGGSSSKFSARDTASMRCGMWKWTISSRQLALWILLVSSCVAVFLTGAATDLLTQPLVAHFEHAGLPRSASAVSTSTLAVMRVAGSIIAAQLSSPRPITTAGCPCLCGARHLGLHVATGPSQERRSMDRGQLMHRN